MIELVPTSAGVHVHVAVWLDPDPDVETLEQPEMALPPFLNVTLPETFVDEVIVLEAP